MAKLALALAAIGCLIAAAVLDWRAALLMIAAWWADNILKKLVERDRV